MMHKKNFVAAIKVDGKVLRESSDRVQLPFGSEYSVMLKNLDTVRMQAKIEIDGQDASGWLVVDPGKSIDVERFYRQNRDNGNRFKFIERTERIEQHRGIGAEDGLVRIEFKREKVYETPKIVEHHTYYHHTWPYVYPRPYFYSEPCFKFNSDTAFIGNAQTTNNSSLSPQSGILRSSGSRSLRGSASGMSASGAQASGALMASCSNSMTDMWKYSQQNQNQQSQQNEAGITVDGSISDQKFIPVAGFECEASEVIVLHLVGRTGSQPIQVAKTVAQRPLCVTCGKKNKGTAKFCIECGTSLEKV